MRLRQLQLPRARHIQFIVRAHCWLSQEQLTVLFCAIGWPELILYIVPIILYIKKYIYLFIYPHSFENNIYDGLKMFVSSFETLRLLMQPTVKLVIIKAQSALSAHRADQILHHIVCHFTVGG